MKTYTLKQAADKLGKSTGLVIYWIGKADIPVTRTGRLYQITEKQIEQISQLSRQSPRAKRRRFASFGQTWYVKKLLTSKDAESPDTTEAFRWAQYLNGHWTKKRPSTPGVYFVQAIDGGLPQYREFRTVEQIHRWVGWFWSKPLPSLTCAVYEQ